MVTSPGQHPDSPADDAGTPRSARPGREAVTRAAFSAMHRLYAERGPSEVSLREIATQTGFSHTLLLHYFGTKDDLVREFIVHERRSVATRLGGVTDPREAVRMLVPISIEYRGLLRAIVFWASLGEERRFQPSDFPVAAFLVELQRATGFDEARIERTRPALAMLVTLLMGWQACSEWMMESYGIADEPQEHILDALTRAVLAIYDEAADGTPPAPV